MKEKKQSSYWNIAVTHFLTSGFTAFIITLALVIILIMLFGKESLALLIIARSIISLLAIWLGVMYSAKYIDKTYIIQDSDKIVKSATIYLVIVSIGFWFYNIANNIGSGTSISIVNIYLFIDIFFFILQTMAFYFFSKKYIHNNSQYTEQVTNQAVNN